MNNCEMCDKQAMSACHEYKEDGSIIVHHACIDHLVETVAKYQDSFKNNKW